MMTTVDLRDTLAKPKIWVKLAAYALLLFFVFRWALEQLVLHDWNKEDYNYCYIVPFLVLYLVWEKRKELVQATGCSSWTGAGVVALGIVLFWLGDLGGEFYTLYVSLWIVIVGLLWMHFGWKKIKTVWFALVVLLAAFPFPNVINFPLALRLRLISSEIGVKLLHLVGMSAYREGNVIDLGFTQLQVVDACSGIRYLFPLMLLALLLAYWFQPEKKRGKETGSCLPPASLDEDGQRRTKEASVMAEQRRLDAAQTPRPSGADIHGSDGGCPRPKGLSFLLGNWKRVVLFLSSIPIAIMVNALRIAITGMLYPLMGAAAAEGFFHDFSGWLIFMFTIPILLGEMWILKRLC